MKLEIHFKLTWSVHCKKDSNRLKIIISSIPPSNWHITSWLFVMPFGGGVTWIIKITCEKILFSYITLGQSTCRKHLNFAYKRFFQSALFCQKRFLWVCWNSLSMCKIEHRGKITYIWISPHPAKSGALLGGVVVVFGRKNEWISLR